MSETIPPSLVLITIGSVTNVSISALFTGGLLPALVAAAALVAVAWWRSRSEDTGGRARVEGSPAIVDEENGSVVGELGEGFNVVEHSSMKHGSKGLPHKIYLAAQG